MNLRAPEWQEQEARDDQDHVLVDQTLTLCASSTAASRNPKCMLSVALLRMKQPTDQMRLRSNQRKISGLGRKPRPFPFYISVATPRMLNLHEKLAAKLEQEWDRQESEGSRVLLFATHQEEFVAVFAEDCSCLRPGLELSSPLAAGSPLAGKLCWYKARMSTLILTGGLQSVLPGRTAIAGKPGEQCAVCEACNSLIP